MFTCSVSAQSNYLDAEVSMQVSEQKIITVLAQMERVGGFGFSFNSDQIPTDSLISFSAKSETVEQVLHRMLGKELEIRESGRHIILIKPTSLSKRQNRKVEFTISGNIRNAKTGRAIRNASVYHIDDGNSVLTSNNGAYQLTIESREADYSSVKFSRRGYDDTVVVINAKSNQNIEINLKPRPPKMEPIATPTVQLVPSPTMDTLGLVQLMVNEDMLEQTLNLQDVYEVKLAQFSVIPNVGTNGRLSGLYKNNFSFNLLGGYSQGVDGLEIGGLMNINRGDMNGMQIAGFGNVLGGKVRGMQVGGFFNFNYGKMNGLQISGFSNTVVDTMNGVQITGFSNIARTDMNGVQISGFSNVGFEDVDGVQISGFSNFARYNVDGAQISGFGNVAIGDVNVVQIAGFGNYATNVNGAQIAGFTNIARDSVRGAQIAGFSNQAHFVGSSQIAGFMNLSFSDVHGSQISGFANIAKNVKGSQLGVFNFCDSIRGVPFGVFSYVKKGLHKFEVGASTLFPTFVEFRTGVYKLHNIFSGGYVNRGFGAIYAAGFGFGSEWGERWGKGRFHLGLDVVSYQQFQVGESLNGLDIVSTARLNFVYGKRVRFVIGPTFDTQITNQLDLDTNEPLVKTAPDNGILLDEWSEGTRFLGWLGARAAIRF